MDVHVVSKSDNRQHATFQIPAPTEPLKPSSVRVRTSLLGLTTNNLTYALAGASLHWWDAYPVPSTAPAPYNDQSKWGIVPAWGLSTVIESTIPEIQPGTVFFGFWPTSNHAVDLQLKAVEPAGHWVDVSRERETLMSLYNRYIVYDTKGKDIAEFAWEAAVRPIWVAGYVLSEYVFTSDPARHPVVYPLGGTEGWTVEDADLSKAVFVSLAASTKTGRATAYNLFSRAAGAGPLGLLEVTSSPDSLAEAAEKLGWKIPAKALSYEDIEQSGEWLAGIEAERIVIADFGAREGALDKLLDSIKGRGKHQSSQITIFRIGYEQKVYTPQDIQSKQDSGKAAKTVLVNTSPILETILQLVDPKVYFEEFHLRWNQWLADRESAAPDLRLVVGEGVLGANGIEGGWHALCESSVRPADALVYRM
ncbi:hypothetical protein BJX99DRAFT_238024 [Aspergillus californicus]